MIVRVEYAGSVMVDLELLNAETALALVRLFDGCGKFFVRFGDEVTSPYMHWVWGGQSRNYRRWRRRADALRGALE